MASLPVEDPPSKMVVMLRIKYNRTTIVLNILLTSVLLKKVMHCLVAVAFFWDTLYIKMTYLYFIASFAIC